MSKSERDIVEALAALDEPLHDSGFGDSICTLCGANRPYDPHADDCPWQMARDHVESRDGQ